MMIFIAISYPMNVYFVENKRCEAYLICYLFGRVIREMKGKEWKAHKNYLWTWMWMNDSHNHSISATIICIIIQEYIFSFWKIYVCISVVRNKVDLVINTDYCILFVSFKHIQWKFFFISFWTFHWMLDTVLCPIPDECCPSLFVSNIHTVCCSFFC